MKKYLKAGANNEENANTKDNIKEIISQVTFKIFFNFKKISENLFKFSEIKSDNCKKSNQEAQLNLNNENKSFTTNKQIVTFNSENDLKNTTNIKTYDLTKDRIINLKNNLLVSELLINNKLDFNQSNIQLKSMNLLDKQLFLNEDEDDIRNNNSNFDTNKE